MGAAMDRGKLHKLGDLGTLGDAGHFSDCVDRIQKPVATTNFGCPSRASAPVLGDMVPSRRTSHSLRVGATSALGGAAIGMELECARESVAQT